MALHAWAFSSSRAMSLIICWATKDGSTDSRSFSCLSFSFWVLNLENMLRIVGIHFFRYYIQLLKGSWSPSGLHLYSRKHLSVQRAIPLFREHLVSKVRKEAWCPDTVELTWSQRHTNYLLSLSRKHLFSDKKFPGLNLAPVLQTEIMWSQGSVKPVGRSQGSALSPNHKIIKRKNGKQR